MWMGVEEMFIGAWLLVMCMLREGSLACILK